MSKSELHSNLNKTQVDKLNFDPNGNFQFLIENDQDGGVKKTTYFDTEFANVGAMYVSWNDSNARIFLPKQKEQIIASETKEAFTATVELRDPYILFFIKDNQPEEFRITINQEFTDRGLFRELDEKKKAKLFLYGETLGLIKVIPLDVAF